MFAPEPLPTIAEIWRRLQIIFPEGISNRTFLTREMTAKIIFVMLYIDAIEDNDVWLTPKHVVRMTQEQSYKQEEEERQNFQKDCLKDRFELPGTKWYQENSREPIRDECIVKGLYPKGCVTIKPDLPPTSSKPRYALYKHFARLFVITNHEFEEEIEAWKENHLSETELNRIQIIQERHSPQDTVLVTLPSGESRRMESGPSSRIAKSVVEEFAPRFLNEPSVLWISQSRKKSVVQDQELMQGLGLPIDQKSLLPDMILADLIADNHLLVFVEVVATDGPIDEQRKELLLKLAKQAGYSEQQIVFVTAFEDRGSAPLRKKLTELAKDSIVWCRSEPDLLIWLGENQELLLNSLKSKL
jgi:hypothetical protein